VSFDAACVCCEKGMAANPHSLPLAQRQVSRQRVSLNRILDAKTNAYRAHG
jgi:hypothetical protein